MGVKVKATMSERGLVFSIMKRDAGHRDIVAEVAAEVFSDWGNLFGKPNVYSERAVAEVSNAEILGRGLKLKHILIEKGKERECLEEFRKEAGIAEDKFVDILKEMRSKQGVWIEVAGKE